MADSRSEDFIQALRRLEEDSEIDDMVSLFAEEAELSNTTDTEPHRGREGARRFWETYRRSFEDVHSDFRNVAEAADVIMLEWTSRGRAAEGAPFEYDGVSVVEFQDGMIRRFRAYFDPASVLEQN